MAEKVKLEAHEVAEILKEDDEKNNVDIDWMEAEKIEGEVVNELISPRYEDKSSNNKTILLNKSEEEKDSESRKIKRGRGKRKTPAVDGEEFDIKRTYMMRKSTVRMTNQLKGMSEDVDIHISTIIDIAIRDYFMRAVEARKNTQDIYL